MGSDTKKSAADFCREREWQPGQLFEETYHGYMRVFELTAIGRYGILMLYRYGYVLPSPGVEGRVFEKNEPEDHRDYLGALKPIDRLPWEEPAHAD